MKDTQSTDATDVAKKIEHKMAHVVGCKKDKDCRCYSGNPFCYNCGWEYEPYSGDGDGLCFYCYNGVPRE